MPVVPQEAVAEPKPALAPESYSSYFLIPMPLLNEIVGTLLGMPARESMQLLLSLEGIRTLDEYELT